MSVDMTVPVRPAGSADDFLRRAAPRRAAAAGDHGGNLQFGIDLGTATIVLCAVDTSGEPVYWDSVTAQAVRDGVVVDFQRAVTAVRHLVERAEETLGVAVDAASTAYPPGVPMSDCRACRYVVEQSGVRCRALVDEVSAAQALLRIEHGAIVDVGGGSTGVGLYRDGELQSLTDRPGGGHHLDLILAGALGISIQDAEHLKRTDGSAHVQTLAPGIERIAESVLVQCHGRDPGELHLAGGALMLPGAAEIIKRYLGWATVAHPHADLITPFGIAVT